MKLSRRSVLTSVFSGSAAYWVGLGKRILNWPMAAMSAPTRHLNSAPVAVHEVTMVAPDIIRVEVRDGSVIKGPLMGLSRRRIPGPYDKLLTRTIRNPALSKKRRSSAPTKDTSSSWIGRRSTT